MVEYLDTSEKLEHFLASRKEDKNVALDSEFVRDKTYYPKLCLLQLGFSDGAVGLVDTLAISDIACLWNYLLDPKHCLVVHAGRQDLEIIFQHTGQLPPQVFDTQIAAMVCGLGAQLSYQHLVVHFFQANLHRSMTLADWEHRPLSREQLDYAADDVLYLLHLQDVLLEKMGEKKYPLFRELVSKMLWAIPQQFDPEQAIKRFRLGRMDERQRQRVKNLASLREVLAQRNNLPRNWILSNRKILALGLDPLGEEEKDHLRRYGASVEEISMLEAYDDSKFKRVPLSKISPPTLTQAEMEQYTLLKALLVIRAWENNIEARLLATKGELLEFIKGIDSSPLLKGWRYEAFGDAAKKLLQGHLQISYDPETKRITYIKPDK